MQASNPTTQEALSRGAEERTIAWPQAPLCLTPLLEAASLVWPPTNGLTIAAALDSMPDVGLKDDGTPTSDW